MKTLEFDAEIIGTAASLDDALRAAFSMDVLRHVHGDGVHSVEPWEKSRSAHDKEGRRKDPPPHDMERNYKVRSPIPPTLPPVLRHLAGGSDAEIEMTVRQRAWQQLDGRAWKIESKFKLHVPCGRMVRVKCYFLIQRNPESGRVSLANSVKARVLLPAPLNQVAEEYVLQMFMNSVASHAEAVRKELSSNKE